MLHRDASPADHHRKILAHRLCLGVEISLPSILMANFDAASHAQASETRLTHLAHASPSVTQSLTVEDHEQISYVMMADEVLFVMTEQEAKASGKSRHRSADEQLEKMQKALQALPPSNNHVNRRRRCYTNAAVRQSI